MIAMNTIRKYFQTLLLVTVLVSCEDFEQMNQDPNNPSSIPSHMLMSGSEKWIFDNLTDLFTVGSLYRIFPQYWSRWAYSENSRYEIKEANNGDLFNNLYLGVSNLEKVIRMNSDQATASANAVYGANCNQIAAAKILKVWLMCIITDTWGDVPYSDASQLETGVYYTRYDLQKDIYASMLQELKEASDMIDESKLAFISGSDLIYDGDATKWKRFANSLRCRLAVHLSKVDVNWKKYIREAVADGVFQSIDDAALFHYSSAGTEYCKFYENFFVRNRTDYAFSKPLADLMNGVRDELNGKKHPWEGVVDPRLILYSSALDGKYKGMGYGMSTEYLVEGRTGVSNWSKSPTFFLKKDFAVPLMTYAELMFILSEANDYSVEEYRKGVGASIRFWAIQAMTNIEMEDSEAYIEAVSRNVDAESVAIQKYIDLYLNGMEAWTEIRRTGYPEQLIRPGEVSDVLSGKQVIFIPLGEVKGDIIRRLKYPTNESTLNGKYWQEAVERLQGGINSLYSPMYWDVRTSTYNHPVNK